MKTVLFVGAGRNQRRAIERVQELGGASSPSTGTPTRPASRSPTPARPSTSPTPSAVADVGRRHAVDGVMTIAADSAVPIVARGRRAARPARDRLRDGAPRDEQDRDAAACSPSAASPQPQFAALRRQTEVRAAARAVGFPAVLKPADSAGQRGIFLVHDADELAAQMAFAIAASRVGGGDRRALPRGPRGEHAARRARRRRAPHHRLRPPPPRRHRLRRRARARLPVDALRRRARGGGARRGRSGARDRPAQRHRVSAAPRLAARQRGARHRDRGAHPRRADGRDRRATASASTSSRSPCSRRSASPCPTSS